LDGQQLRLTELNEQRICAIGREPGSMLDLSDPAKHEWYGTVSRRHAEIRPTSGTFVVSHLSRTNATRVNGVDVPATQPRRLIDRDVISIGRLQLMFHDLPAADRLSGVICPSCQRENEPSRHDCWYDGTNLASAFSVARRRLRVSCRLVAAGGSPHDLYADEPTQALAILANGQLEKRLGRQAEQSAVGTITIGEHGPLLVATELDVTVNGKNPPPDGVLLKTADELRAAGGHYIVMLR
jgi:hypothetical protein